MAGGNGSRMNKAIPKQFLLLKNKPVLYYSINAFLQAYEDVQIILVLPEDYVAAGQEMIDAFFSYNNIQITIGGPTRFHSVQNGLKLISEESVIFVHDAVRCLVSKKLIQNCYEAVLKNGTAIPVIDSKDSVRMITNNGSEAIERNSIKIVQTPQAFYSNIILPAFHIDHKEKFTDEATVVEAFGIKVHLVEGEQNNIKITYPIDIELAEKILAEKITQ